MKKLILILVLLPMIFGFKGTENTVKKLAVRKESKISILGSSNVNHFSFDIKNYSGNDTLILAGNANDNGAIFKKGVLRLEVNDFKNPNPILTKDFRKIIKSKTYPQILMLFKNLSNYPRAHNGTEQGVAEVQIFLSGQTKIIKLHVKTQKESDVILLSGTAKLCFSDFGLSAPEKVMGFIDVNDELQVNFQLTLREI